jgi:hypothetical protein
MVLWLVWIRFSMGIGSRGRLPARISKSITRSKLGEGFSFFFSIALNNSMQAFRCSDESFEFHNSVNSVTDTATLFSWVRFMKAESSVRNLDSSSEKEGG